MPQVDACMVNLASANVNTLLPWEEGTSYGRVGGRELLLSKVQLLEYEFMECDLHILGVQEGRSPTTGVKEGLYYKMLCAPSQRGNYGVQLWVARSVKHELLAWDVVSPRLLWAALKHKNGCVVVYIVGHAPTEVAEDKIAAAFFDDLSKLVGEMMVKYEGAEVLVFLDANGRIGSVASEFIGSCDADEESRNGTELRLLLEQRSLFAVNTFHSIGHTWRSSRGSVSRIDYILASRRLYCGVHRCCILRDLDLTFTGWEDHSAVMAGVFVHPGPAVHEPRVKAFRPSPCRWRMADPCRVEHFQQMVWQFQPSSGCTIDEHCHQLTEHLRNSAIAAFGTCRDSPRQAWISWKTWDVVRMVAPLRRSISRMARLRNAIILQAVMTSWAAVPMAGGSDSAMPEGMLQGTRRRFCLLERLCAGICGVLYRTRKLASSLIVVDREDFLYRLARKATSAARTGDFRVAYAAVRVLKGVKTAGRPGVRLANGDMAATRIDSDLRWQEHFCSATGGRIVEQGSRSPCDHPGCSGFYIGCTFTPEEVELANAALPSNKGVGPDGIAAELLKAGASAVAVKQCELQNRAGQHGVWPSQWQGGRCVPIHKGKGPKDLCDEYRGLLLADHMSKSMVGTIKRRIDSCYNDNISQHQYGAVPGRGADFAHHVVLSLHERAQLLNWSVFTVFVDLSQAFDRVPRELVLGWPRSVGPGRDEQIAHLTSMGINPHAATHICEYIDLHGPLFHQWGMDQASISMLSTLHDGSWFSIGELQTAVEYGLGGRQGCKVGATIFNAAYDIPLQALRRALAARGVALHVRRSPAAFWAPEAPPARRASGKSHDASCSLAVDAAFIDDECIVIMGPSNVQLAEAIEGTVHDVASIFAAFGLVINWKPRKSEAMLHARGAGAKALLSRFAHPDGAYVEVPAVPGADGAHRLHLVRRYKHLGSFVQSEGGLMSEARWRAQQAMAAYAPMAFRIFANSDVCIWLKYILMQSMVISRLLYMAHTKVPTVKFIKILQAVYMRVLRRIHGQCAYQRTLESDLALRRRIQQPSIDCLLMRARMRYVRRLVQCKPVVLAGLLHTRVRGRLLPWCELVLADFEWLRKWSCIDAFRDAPDPSVDPDWWSRAASDSSWPGRVSRIFFAESVADPPIPGNPGLACAQPFQCLSCMATFPDQRRLTSHMQRSHAWRLRVHLKIDGSGTCPACHAAFSNRFDVLQHLRNVRACRSDLEDDRFPFVPAAEIGKLQELDRQLRAQARSQGRSVPFAGEVLIAAK